MTTLADIKPGQTARIEAIDTAHGGVLRLMILGLVEGTEIQYVNAAIGGDPMEVSVFGTSVSLRRDLARCFRVSLYSDNG